MTGKLLLRISSALLFVHLIGHSFGNAGWKKATDPVKMQVIHLMTGPKFPFMGVDRSMGEYYEGYGYITSAALVLMIVLLWLASNQMATRNVFARQASVTISTLLVVIALLEFVYFFPFAAIISLFAGLLAIGAWFLSKTQQASISSPATAPPPPPSSATGR